MEKVILSAIFLIAAGIYIREYSSQWGLGGLFGLVGVAMGFVVLMVWAAPHLAKSWKRFMEGWNENKDGE